MTLNVNAPQAYSTNPVDYLQRLQGGASSNSSDVLKEVLQLLGEVLKQMQGQGGAGAGGAGGMPGGTGALPGGTGAMPGGTSAMPGATTGALPGGTGGLPNGAAGGTPPMTAQNASGVLASYMGQNNISADDPNALYQLAENGNGNTPPTVQQAAKFMLQNPDIYKQIETHDVAGADGKSGVGNFQWAAQGGLGAAGNVPAGAGGLAGATGALPGGTGALPGSTGGLPGATATPPVKGTGDLVNDGKSLQLNGEGAALSKFSTQDAPDFQAFQNALSHGDGNTATHVLANAVSSGKISQADGAALGAQLQQTANAHGGGKINDDARNALKNALSGADVLAPGKTRGEIAFDNITGMKTDQIFGISTK